MDKGVASNVLLGQAQSFLDQNLAMIAKVKMLEILELFADSNDGLLGFCPLGTFSPRDGLPPCTTCKIGFYQDVKGSRHCQRCPSNTATWRRGAKKLQDCQRNTTFLSNQASSYNFPLGPRSL